MILLIHSVQSTACKKFIENLAHFPPDIEIKTLSVDSKKIRDRVKAESKIPITSVPCILIYYPDGNVEKYEGQDAFNWQNEILAKLQEKADAEAEEKARAQAHAEAQAQAKADAEAMMRALEEEDDDEEEYIPPPSKRKSKKKKKKKAASKTVTMITDLESDEEEEEYVPQSMKKTRMTRSDVGNYELEEFEDDGGEVMRNVGRGVKKSSEKKDDILSIAQAMQKDRE